MKESENIKYLLKGDLSGIQDFIFSIPSKGAAKTLKVRSFFIQAITQLCISKLMDDNKLEQRISDRGGSFYLGMDNEIDNIESVQAQLNKELFELGLFLTLSQTNFDTWSSANSRLSEKEEKQKFTKYAHTPESFEAFKRISPIDINCWKNFANKLSDTKARYTITKNTSDILTTDSISLFGYTLTLSANGDNNKTSFNEVPVWRKDNIYFQKKDEYPIKKWELESAQDNADENDAIREGCPINLSHLGLEARYRTGTDRIAAIALDIDNLGVFFKDKDIEEMKRSEESLKSFFIDKIGDIWEKEKFNDEYHYRDNILILFSGGDDCFILGAWDACIYFLSLLHKEFEIFIQHKKLSVNSRPLSFSASILITDASFPMIRLGDMTEDLLSIAKKGNKNSVCLFEQKFTWHEYNDIISIAKTLRDLIVNKGESKALVQKIALSAKGYKKLIMDIKRTKPLSMEKVWNLTWFILRGTKKENREEVDDKIVRKYHEAVIKALTDKRYSNALVYPFAARITELLIRNKD
jgi:CRISPR-associated protein Csm1